MATALENIFPPTPSDVMVALAAFLTHRSGTPALAVFLVAWLANAVGAVVVYGLSRRYGRRFFEGKVGRRLLTPGAIVSMEREYLRFGVAGIFFSRLLPGFRSFVAPFAGLIRMPALKALLPMVLASGLWYAVLVYVGAALGAEWERIHDLIGHLNRALAIAAVAAAVLLTVWIVRRQRRQPRYERLWGAIHRALHLPDIHYEAPDPAAAGAAGLLYELARADREITGEELALIESYLRDRWSLGAAPKAGPGETSPAPTSSAGFATELAALYERPTRLELVERLWRVVMSDARLAAHEKRLMGRAAELLGLNAEDLAEALHRARV